MRGRSFNHGLSLSQISEKGYVVIAILDELTNPVIIDTDDDPGIEHLYCCNEKVSLCGTDLEDAVEVDDFYLNDGAMEQCVVCRDLDELECPRCGL